MQARRHRRCVWVHGQGERASKFFVIMFSVTSNTASKMCGTSASISACSLLMIVANRLRTSASLRVNFLV